MHSSLTSTREQKEVDPRNLLASQLPVQRDTLSPCNKAHNDKGWYLTPPLTFSCL